MPSTTVVHAIHDVGYELMLGETTVTNNAIAEIINDTGKLLTISIPGGPLPVHLTVDHPGGRRDWFGYWPSRRLSRRSPGERGVSHRVEASDFVVTGPGHADTAVDPAVVLQSRCAAFGDQLGQDGVSFGPLHRGQGHPRLGFPGVGGIHPGNLADRTLLRCAGRGPGHHGIAPRSPLSAGVLRRHGPDEQHGAQPARLHQQGQAIGRRHTSSTSASSTPRDLAGHGLPGTG